MWNKANVPRVITIYKYRTIVKPLALINFNLLSILSKRRSRIASSAILYGSGRFASLLNLIKNYPKVWRILLEHLYVWYSCYRIWSLILLTHYYICGWKWLASNLYLLFCKITWKLDLIRSPLSVLQQHQSEFSRWIYSASSHVSLLEILVGNYLLQRYLSEVSSYNSFSYFVRHSPIYMW